MLELFYGLRRANESTRTAPNDIDLSGFLVDFPNSVTTASRADGRKLKGLGIHLTGR